MSGRLADKVAIVVGAGSTPGETIGNGRATAILFAREGAQVCLVDRHLASAEETREQIASEGGSARVCQADVTRDEDCARLVEDCVQAFGRVDVLHNNVGIGDIGGPVELDEERWNRVFDTNLRSMFLTCKHALPHMERQGSGAIVNVSSVAAIRFAPYPMLSYSASKAAVNALTRSVAMQYAAKGVRSNAIMPGLIETPMAMEGIAAGLGIDKQRLKQVRDAAVPMGHMGQGWDVAYAALYLASDEARYVTGVVLPVDGGLTLKG
jgi:NAD(P)-dependent dehydrogenase (short-subunit alcohol dehydrogenase family)